VPCFIRWPGTIKPGSVFNDIFAHEDMLPTLMAATGVPDVKEQLLKGMKVGNTTFKVHLDGYNLTDALAGKAPSPRKEFFYFGDNGWCRSATISGRSSSRSSVHKALKSGSNCSRHCAGRRFSTSARIHSRLRRCFCKL
jgi:hypothetical protein